MSRRLKAFLSLRDAINTLETPLAPRVEGDSPHETDHTGATEIHGFIVSVGILVQGLVLRLSSPIRSGGIIR